MLALAGVPLGVRCLVVEPAPGAPAGAAAEVLTAPYDDPTALAELARRCDVVTVELEGVPVAALDWLAERVPVQPNPRGRRRHAGSTGREGSPSRRRRPDRAVGGRARRSSPEGTVVKARRGGFDGRGQVVVPPGADVAAAAPLGDDVISEGLVAFGARSPSSPPEGATARPRAYPVVENVHADGILRRTLASGARAERGGASGRHRSRLPGVGRARLRRGARHRALRSRRGRGGQRGRPPGPQLRALDDRRGRDQPVRAAPPGDPRLAARLGGAASASAP